MDLFIQIRNGQPFEHPIFGDNFRQAFPHIDVNNLPPEFARFERVQCPNNASTFQVDELTYQWVDNVVKDVWSVRDMTQEEHAQRMVEITNRVLNDHKFYIEYTQRRIEESTGDAQKAWEEHLVALNAWALVDPLKPKFPKAPIFNEDGTVYTVNDAGSAPNVIE
jgi:hypothetical protein